MGDKEDYDRMSTQLQSVITSMEASVEYLKGRLIDLLNQAHNEAIDNMFKEKTEDGSE